MQSSLIPSQSTPPPSAPPANVNASHSPHHAFTARDKEQQSGLPVSFRRLSTLWGQADFARRGALYKAATSKVPRPPPFRSLAEISVNAQSAAPGVRSVPPPSASHQRNSTACPHCKERARQNLDVGRAPPSSAAKTNTAWQSGACFALAGEASCLSAALPKRPETKYSRAGWQFPSRTQVQLR